MTTRSYNSIANACVFLGVASAFGFDRNGHPGWLVLGVAVAVVAVVIYFRRHWYGKPGSVGPSTTGAQAQAESLWPAAAIERLVVVPTEEDEPSVVFVRRAPYIVHKGFEYKGWRELELEQEMVEVFAEEMWTAVEEKRTALEYGVWPTVHGVDNLVEEQEDVVRRFLRSSVVTVQ